MITTPSTEKISPRGFRPGITGFQGGVSPNSPGRGSKPGSHLRGGGLGKTTVYPERIYVHQNALELTGKSPLTTIIFTARKQSLRRLCFHRCLSVQKGGGVPAQNDMKVHTNIATAPGTLRLRAGTPPCNK